MIYECPNTKMVFHNAYKHDTKINTLQVYKKKQ